MTDFPLRRATSADRDAIADTLAEAFAEDPAFQWMFPDIDARNRHLVALFALNFEIDLPVSTILTSPAQEAASFWRPPGHPAASTADFMRHPVLALEAFGTNVLRVNAVANAIAAHLPTEGPFWHVHFVGVLPACQRKGWGHAMMAAGEAQAGGADIYLETARPANVEFYSKIGYHVTGEWNVPDGPHMWSMLKRHVPV